MRFEGDNEELVALGVPQGSSEEVAVLGAQCCRTAAATGASDPAATGASAAATGALDPAAAGARAAATGASDPAAAGASVAATGASDPAATGAIAAATGAIDPAAAGASAAATGASDPAATGAIAAATGAIDPAATGASAAVDDLGALPQSGGWLYADEDQGAGWSWDNGWNTSARSMDFVYPYGGPMDFFYPYYGEPMDSVFFPYYGEPTASMYSSLHYHDKCPPGVVCNLFEHGECPPGPGPPGRSMLPKNSEPEPEPSYYNSPPSPMCSTSFTPVTATVTRKGTPVFDVVPNDIRFPYSITRLNSYFGLKLQYTNPGPGGILYVAAIDKDGIVDRRNAIVARTGNPVIVVGDAIENVNRLTAIDDGPLKLYEALIKESHVRLQVWRVNFCNIGDTKRLSSHTRGRTGISAEEALARNAARAKETEARESRAKMKKDEERKELEGAIERAMGTPKTLATVVSELRLKAKEIEKHDARLVETLRATDTAREKVHIAREANKAKEEKAVSAAQEAAQQPPAHAAPQPRTQPQLSTGDGVAAVVYTSRQKRRFRMVKQRRLAATGASPAPPATPAKLLAATGASPAPPATPG